MPLLRLAVTLNSDSDSQARVLKDDALSGRMANATPSKLRYLFTQKRIAIGTFRLVVSGIRAGGSHNQVVLHVAYVRWSSRTWLLTMGSQRLKRPNLKASDQQNEHRYVDVLPRRRSSGQVAHAAV